jgi:hypothetical protein
MLGPAGYLLALLSCGEGDAPCQQIGQAPVRYASQAECLAATEEQLARNSDLDHPVVVAECRAEGMRPASLNADEVQKPAARQLPRLRIASRGR